MCVDRVSDSWSWRALEDWWLARWHWLGSRRFAIPDVKAGRFAQALC
jgi:hypothetical protein